MTATPDPGWYPDPEGGAVLRWWDGAKWTDHTSATDMAAQRTGVSTMDAGTADASDWGTGASDTRQPQLQYASFGARAVALIIDVMILMCVVAVPLLLLLTVVTVLAGTVGSRVAEAVSLLFGLLLYAAIFGGPWAYQILFEGGAYGQSIGKWTMNISVRLPDGSGPIGSGKAAGRTAMRFVSGMFYLGYLWMLWDREKRTWHDIVVNVRVVKVEQKVPFGALLRAGFRKN